MKAKMSRSDSITKVVSEMTSAFSAVCTNRHSDLVTSAVDADGVAGGGTTVGIDAGGVDVDRVCGGGDVVLVWPKVVFTPPTAMVTHTITKITVSFFMACVPPYLVQALCFV